MKIMIAALAFLFSLTVSLSAEEVERRMNRFQLFNDCRPIDLAVEGLSEDARKIGLTKESLITAAESRLRSARLYDAEASNHIYINVNVVGMALNVLLEYNKELLDLSSGEFGTAMTWRTGSTGTHGRDASYIRSAVSEKIDKFLVEYLRVNEEACEKRFSTSRKP